MNSLVAITKFVEGITWDHMSTDKSHRRIWFCTLLSQYRAGKYRMVSTVLPQVNLNLQHRKKHQWLTISLAASMPLAYHSTQQFIAVELLISQFVAKCCISNINVCSKQEHKYSLLVVHPFHSRSLLPAAAASPAWCSRGPEVLCSQRLYCKSKYSHWGLLCWCAML